MNPLDRLLKYWDSYNQNLGKSQMRLQIQMTKQDVDQMMRRMFLEGFKNSAEGYNGEHPPRSDQEMWESIRDDYFKISKKLFENKE